MMQNPAPIDQPPTPDSFFQAPGGASGHVKFADGFTPRQANFNPQHGAQLHTGDPIQDLAFEQQQQQQHQQQQGGPPPQPQHQQQHHHHHQGGFNRGEGGGGGGHQHSYGGQGPIPEEVLEYLRLFKQCVKDQNVPEIHNLYEYGFPSLTEHYYREKFWPDEEKVKQAVGDDSKIFLILYKELYYRYLYAKIQRGPSLEHRYYSFHNYQDLFDYVLNTTEPVPLQLPSQWLWDIVDEFVYQFQSFCQYKMSANKRTPEELDDIRQFEHEVWYLYPVLNILFSLVKKSQINEQLEAINNGGDPLEITDEFGGHPLYFKFGYFSLIGLLRLHSMLGDYHMALESVKHIQFDPTGLYNTVPNCMVTLHYFVGFVKMFKRQYTDAIRLFVTCQLFIQRTRNMLQQQPKSSYQYDIISKTNDQITHLLAICLAIQPQRIDESVQTQLQEKIGEKWGRLQRGELSEFENSFQLACPKFLCPTTALNDTTGNTAREPTIQQTRVFMDEIKQQKMIPILRGFLKLYRTMPTAKLASFAEEVKEDDLISMLLCFKHKMTEQGKEISSEDDPSDMDFYVDKDMIHIADTKVARHLGEYFIRHIQKLQDLNVKLKKMAAKAPPPVPATK